MLRRVLTVLTWIMVLTLLAGTVSAAPMTGPLTLANSITGGTANTLLGGTVTQIVELPSGNIVITAPGWNGGRGAVICLTPAEYRAGNIVISAANALTGSLTTASVGNGGITVLSNGHYVVRSHQWEPTASPANLGAVTWVNGSTCIPYGESSRGAVVSVSNSLVGTAAADSVGSAGVVALANGNYVVGSPGWDNGAVTNVGAVTWCDGSTGCAGAVSTSNSLTGALSGNAVGFRVYSLGNGHYVVHSPGWEAVAGTTDIGAVTWVDGTNGFPTGASSRGVTVSAVNSLVGTRASDQIGSHVTSTTLPDLTVLPNGSYVVSSPRWDNGAGATDAGAVTWCDGTGGCTGAVSSANSLVGSTTNDQVGDHAGGNPGVAVLTDGNYVVRARAWDNGATVDVGAVRWCSGSAGCTGTFSAANALIGAAANHSIGFGRIVPLPAGRYVVTSPRWDNGVATDAGAVTWCDVGGCTGNVTTSNSVYGSALNDFVGTSVVTLTNGNYLICADLWNNGAATDAGAVTWVNGTTGIPFGEVGRGAAASASNSVIGTTTSEQVGYSCTPLSNGHYVLGVPGWDNGALSNAGAVRWCNGTTGCSGALTAANSLTGAQAGDLVGLQVTALTNGNYVTSTLLWDNGAVPDVGAATWVNGSNGHPMGASGPGAVVGVSNSLVGTTTSDFDTLYIVPLSNGNYVVNVPYWGALDYGAVAWGSGSTGTAGVIGAANALVGTNETDTIGSYQSSPTTNGVSALPNGNYVIASGGWNAGFGAVMVGSGTGGTVGAVSSSNALVGGTSSHFVGYNNITLLADGSFFVRSSNWDNGATSNVGALTWSDGELDPCAAYSFPYTLTSASPAELRQAITCANTNGASADVIDLDGFSVVVADSFGDYLGATGLPQITTPITLRNGTITRTGSANFRLLAVSGTGSLTLRQVILGNGGGSGFANNGGTIFAATSSVLTLVDVTMTGSSIGSAYDGSAIFASGTTNIINSTLSGNGGGRGALTAQNGPLLIQNSLISGNSATAASTGGIFLANINAVIHNSTITGNYAASTNASHAGGILTDSSTVNLTIRNSIVWDNRNSNNSAPQIVNASGGSTTVTRSIVQGGGFGGIDSNPLFVSPITASATPNAGGNFRLAAFSPAVDAGANADVPADSYDVNGNSNTTENAPDRDGLPRRYNDAGVTDSGTGTAPIVDFGAYERQTDSSEAVEVDYCNLQFPTSFTAASGATSPVIYGRVYEDDNGVLTSSPGAHPSISAQLGYGPLASDPRNKNPAWRWFATTYNVQVGNDDEYMGTFAVPYAPTGTQLSYTYRVSLDGGVNYTYCDINGNGTNLGLGFSAADLGTLTISPGGLPTLSINDVSANEGNSGVTNFVFTVSLNGPSLSAVTFDIATADNTATTANNDYAANSASLMIPAGQTSITFTVQVNGDITAEPNETFFVNITNVVGASVGDGQGQGTIVNDDDPCLAYSYPYTLTGNTQDELRLAIACANANGASADVIDLNGQTVTLTNQYAISSLASGIGLPEITTPMTVQNGAIVRSSSELFHFFVNNSQLTLNHITLSGGNPGVDGGAIMNWNGAALTINHGRIVGNYGNFGGAIFNGNGASLTLTNTLVAGNRGNSTGGGIRNRGTLVLNNSTIAANFTSTSTLDGGGGISSAGTYSVVLNNSLVYGNEANTANPEINGAYTNNNSLVGVNPSFVNLLDASDTAPTTAGDYRLGNLSVAVDAGNNSLIPSGVTTDLDGSPRRYDDTGVADSGVGTAPIVDIGAYEKQTNSVLQADVSITKTDGQTTEVPGTSVTYTIVASNAGPNNAPTVTVTDTFPASVTGVTWMCVGAGGGSCTASGSGNISETVNLPVGGSVTFTATGTISPSAVGTLSNTAVASVGGGVSDPNPSNNSATDTDTLTPQADVSITKTDGLTEAVAGTSITYHIVASNSGPSNDPTVTVTDTFPASITGVTWTCVGVGGGTCTAAGSGNLNETVNLPVGGSVTFTATGTISPSAVGVLSNTATASVSGGVSDPDPSNNSSTDNTTVVPPAGITISPTTVNVAEGGAADSYTLVLDAAPAADVTVELTFGGQVRVSTDGTNFFAAPVMVTFTTANWAAPRTITVQAVDDFVAEGPHNTSVDHDLSSADPNYDGLLADSVTANITDNDAAGVTISAAAVNVTEGGAANSYTVVLTSQPTGDVSITVNGDAQASVSPLTLMFTASGGTAWNIPQTVTVTAVDDAVAEGAHTGSITHGAASTDANYNGISIAGVTANITDNDTAGVTISAAAVNLTEGGAADSYTVVLTSQPTGDVTISVSGDAQASASPTTLTFTASGGTAWNIPQTVTVTAVDDTVAEGAHTGGITHGVASTDANYNGISIAGVTANITDNDIAGVTVMRSGGTTLVVEGGADDTLDISLTTQPTADVTVTLTAGAQLGVSPTTLTFTVSGGTAWNIPQTVTVTAVDDAVYEGLHADSIQLAVTSADPAYGLTLPDEAVTIADGVSEMLRNGGFETAGAQARYPAQWPRKNLSVKDRRVCGTAPVYEGSCAFRFQFTGPFNLSRTLRQPFIAPAWGDAGDTLTLSAYVRAGSLRRGAFLRVNVFYTNGTTARLNIPVPNGTYDYTLLTNSITLTRRVSKVVVVAVVTPNATGTLFVDGMSLRYQDGTPLASPVSGALPLPPAP